MCNHNFYSHEHTHVSANENNLHVYIQLTVISFEIVIKLNKV